jgi:hypothetical protein
MRGHTDTDGDGFRTDGRAASTAVNHVLAIGIATLLIVGLVTGTGGFLNDQTQRVTEVELRDLGNRIADDVAAADRMAQQGGSATVAVDAPDRVADSPYTVALAQGSTCDTARSDADTCLVLEVSQRDVRTVTPLDNRTPVGLTGAEGGGLAVTAGTSATGAGTADLELSPAVRPSVGVGAATQDLTDVTLANQEPIAGFVYRPGTPSVEEEITFRNDTGDLDGAIVAYNWSLEQPTGPPVEKSGRVINYTYQTPGEYNVTLNVTDDDGQSDSVRRDVRVSGLIFDGNVSTDVPFVEGDRVSFDLNSTWNDPVTITQLLVDPEGDQVDRLETDDDGDPPEVAFDQYPLAGAVDETTVEFDGGVDVPEGGLIIDFEEPARTLPSASVDSNTYDGDIAAGERLRMNITGFRGSYTFIDEVPIDFVVRYEVDDTVYTESFDLFSLGSGSDTVTWESSTDWDNSATTNVTTPGGVTRLNSSTATGGGASPPTANQIVYLPLNETGGASDALDEASLEGDNDYFHDDGGPTVGVDGKVGDAYEFTGGDEEIEDAQAFNPGAPGYLEDAEELTIGLWLKSDQTGVDQGVFTNDDDEPGDGQDDELGLRYDQTGATSGNPNTIKASLLTDEGRQQIEGPANVQTTDWQHVAIRYEEGGGAMDLFVDGSKVSTTEIDPGNDGELVGHEQNFIFGKGQKDAIDWDGKMDEIRIYGEHLSDAEMSQLAGGSIAKAEGTVNTTRKATGSSLDLDDLRLGYSGDLDGGSVTATVIAYTDDGDVEFGDPVTFAGNSGVREVQGFATGSGADEFQVRLEYEGFGGAEPEVGEVTLGT